MFLVHKRIECDGYMQEEISFRTGGQTRVEGSVLIPKIHSQNGKFPAVIALHDHSGIYYYGRQKIVEQKDEPQMLTELKESCYGGRSWASVLARRGYLVLVIDGFFFGSRRLDTMVCRMKSKRS